METRMLGGSGIAVSAIGLGCMSLSGVYGAADDAASTTLIHEALDRGVTFLDSSDAYGRGHNEELIGRALRGRRSGAVVATKFGNLGGAGGKFADGRPDFVKASCEASLRRLGIETIDLYFQHRVDPEVPIEETVGAMADLVAEGKVRALGLSEARPETVRRAHKVHPIAAVENEFSLLYRAEADETRAATRDLGIAFVAYSPLGRSLLTMSLGAADPIPDDDGRKRHPRFSEGNRAANLDLVARVASIARDKGCTPGQLALAWLLAEGPDVIPIPGTKRLQRLIENLGALSVDLGEAERSAIAAAVPAGAAAGTRYPEGTMRSVYL